MLFKKVATKRDHGFGLATMADLWVLLFPLSVYIMYVFSQATMEHFESWVPQNTELKRLVKSDSLSYNHSSPRRSFGRSFRW